MTINSSSVPAEIPEIEFSRPINYYFGRFNVIGIYEDKRDFLACGFNTAETISKNNHTWGFFEVDFLQNEVGEFISGFLVKYNPEGAGEEVANPVTRQLGEAIFLNSVAAKSRFFLHIKSGLVAYYLKPGINQLQFQEFFKDIFQKGHGEFFVNADIQNIEERQNFFERIEKLQKILRVSTRLHPSNPSNHDRWKKTDERLKSLGASSYSETYEAKSNSQGLDIKRDEDFCSKAHMAQDGYGKTKVKGMLDDEVINVSTGEEPITALAPSEGEGTRILTEILPTFKSIFSRTPNKNDENKT